MQVKLIEEKKDSFVARVISTNAVLEFKPRPKLKCRIPSVVDILNPRCMENPSMWNFVIYCDLPSDIQKDQKTQSQAKLSPSGFEVSRPNFL